VLQGRGPKKKGKGSDREKNVSRRSVSSFRRTAGSWNREKKANVGAKKRTSYRETAARDIRKGGRLNRGPQKKKISCTGVEEDLSRLAQEREEKKGLTGKETLISEKKDYSRNKR